MRNKYGINNQTVAWAKMMQLAPTNIIEVAPGESISGSISTNVFSRPTVRQLLTRTYLDAFSFYVPFRLLDPNWTEFIAGSTPSLASANVAPAGWLFQQALLDTNTTVAPWKLAAYNLIWNRFFKDTSQDDVLLDSTGRKTVSLRPTTYDTSMLFDDSRLTPPAIGSTTETVRSAFAQERFNRTRAIYGDKYVDYLRALGVETNWTIPDDPELLGQAHSDWKFRMVSNTTEVTLTDPSEGAPLGENGGYFASNISVKIPKTFFPEHGLIISMVVTRADAIQTAPPVSLIDGKTRIEEFWSPERDQEIAEETLPGQFGAIGNPTYQMPKWEEYRKGLNTNSDPAAADGIPYGFVVDSNASADSQIYVRPQPTDFDSSFALQEEVVSSHYQATTQVRATKLSPIKKIRAGGLIG